MNNGQIGDGIWYLLVQDIGSADICSLIDVSLTFCSTAAIPYNVDLSELPASNYKYTR